MTGFPHNRFVIDAHVRFSRNEAQTVTEIMETNNLIRVVNPDTLEALGIPSGSLHCSSQNNCKPPTTVRPHPG
jgi:hypothetical protein